MRPTNKLWYPGEGPILLLRHEGTLELREFHILEAEHPPRFRIHWPMCRDYYLVMKTNRLQATYRGKRGRTDGSKMWRAVEFQKMVKVWNDALGRTGPSYVFMTTPQ
jgi:hypothetical protein